MGICAYTGRNGGHTMKGLPFVISVSPSVPFPLPFWPCCSPRSRSEKKPASEQVPKGISLASPDGLQGYSTDPRRAFPPPLSSM